MKNTYTILMTGLIILLGFHEQLHAQDAILIQTNSSVDSDTYTYELAVINKKPLPSYPRLALYKKDINSKTPDISSEIMAPTAPEFTLDTYTIVTKKTTQPGRL